MARTAKQWTEDDRCRSCERLRKQRDQAIARLHEVIGGLGPMQLKTRMLLTAIVADLGVEL
jgi:hypothetical protein